MNGIGDALGGLRVEHPAAETLGMKEVNAFVLRRPTARGFTLVELMITVAIVGILAGIAYPSFMSQVRKGRRADVVDAASRIMQAQERWRANNASYTSTMSNLTAYGASAASTNGYYSLGLSAASATGYTITATAVSGTSQASDTGCTSLTLTFNATSSPSTSHGQPSCWSR